jgi:hypothetical protein
MQQVLAEVAPETAAGGPATISVTLTAVSGEAEP